MAEQDQLQLGDEEAFRLDLAASLPDESTKVLAELLDGACWSSRIGPETGTSTNSMATRTTPRHAARSHLMPTNTTSSLGT